MRDARRDLAVVREATRRAARATRDATLLLCATRGGDALCVTRDATTLLLCATREATNLLLCRTSDAAICCARRASDAALLLCATREATTLLLCRTRDAEATRPCCWRSTFLSCDADTRRATICASDEARRRTREKVDSDCDKKSL